MKEWRVSAPRKLRNTSYCRREGSDVEEDVAAMEIKFVVRKKWVYRNDKV